MATEAGELLGETPANCSFHLTVNDEILAIIDRYADRLTDHSARPEGSSPVAISATGHPLPRSSRGN